MRNGQRGFSGEIKVHARLFDPNIVPFYNAREIEGHLVMITEYLAGITVAERLESGPAVWKDAVKDACRGLSAVACAHGSGIIQGGLTAANLVITSERIMRSNGFGLAKSTGDPQLMAVGTWWERFTSYRRNRGRVLRLMHDATFIRWAWCSTKC